MIRNAAALSLRLLRLGGPRAWVSAALVGVGIAVGTALLALALGGLHGWDAREARAGWRIDDHMAIPLTPTEGEPVALVRAQTDIVAGQPYTITDLAPLRTDVAPPPGFDRMPAPGEVWVTPAFARLLTELPADQLAARFPSPPTAVIEADGLIAPDELAVVIGRDAATLREDAGPEPVPITRFDQAAADVGSFEFYRELTVVAVVLLVFPVLSLLRASARLNTSRQAQRLATLRLLGASTRQITTVAVTEVAAVALVAAGTGVIVQGLLSPMLAHIELAGHGWYAADLRPSPVINLVIVAGVVVLATIAALDGMRQIVISPLGVARRSRPQHVRWLLRLVGAAVGIAVFSIVSSVMQYGPAEVMGIVFAIGVLALFMVIALIGPVVVRAVASRMVRRARTPAALIAGRRLLDDPKSAFRPLTGVVLAVFVASFLAPLMGAIAGEYSQDDDALLVSAANADVSALAIQARERLAGLGIDATVTPERSRIAVVPGPGEDRDQVRTALGQLTPGRVVRTEQEAQIADFIVLGDLARGALVVMICTFVIAATATGTAAAARVLDHRHTLRLLYLAGMPIGVLDRARRAETTQPLLVNGGIAFVLGLLCASPFAAAAKALEPSGLVLLGVTLAAGVALVLAASAASRPLLRSVATTPHREDP